MLCVNITLFGVAEDPLHSVGSGDPPLPPNSMILPHITTDSGSFVIIHITGHACSHKQTNILPTFLLAEISCKRCTDHFVAITVIGSERRHNQLAAVDTKRHLKRFCYCGYSCSKSALRVNKSVKQCKDTTNTSYAWNCYLTYNNTGQVT